MSLGNGKTQGDISASNSPATAMWGRQAAESLNEVCVFVCVWEFQFKSSVIAV